MKFERIILSLLNEEDGMSSGPIVDASINNPEDKSATYMLSKKPKKTIKRKLKRTKK